MNHVTKRLGEIFIFKNGRAFKKSEWSQTGLPIIRIQNLNNRESGFNFFNGEFSNDILVRNGDLLFSWSGTVGSSFGPHLWDRDEGLLNQHIFKIGYRQSIDKRFAFYALEFITEEIEKQVSGAVGLVHITKEKLNEFLIPTPSEKEQRRIVAIVDEAFEGIATAKANAEKNLQNARDLPSATMAYELSLGGNSWSESKIGEQLTLQRGFDITKDQQRDGLVPVVSSGGVRSYHDTPMVRAPGVVLGRKGTLGKVFFLNEDFWPHDTTLWVKDFKGNDPQFVYRFLQCVDVKSLDSGAANPALNRNQVHALRVFWPPVEEQRAIVEKADSAFLAAEDLQKVYSSKIHALEDLKKSLLHQAFTGQL